MNKRKIVFVSVGVIVVCLAVILSSGGQNVQEIMGSKLQEVRNKGFQDITGYGDWVWVCTETSEIFDEFPDDEDNRLACEAVCGAAPPPERRTEMTLYCTPRSAPLGGTSNAYGILRTITDIGLINKPVRLYRKKPGESYRYQYYVRTDGSGGYIFHDIRIDKLGIWSFYAEFEGDADYDACTSPVFEVECYAGS